MEKEELIQYLRNNLSLSVTESGVYATVSLVLEGEYISTVDIRIPGELGGIPI